ncbi:hypothetical protein HBH56_024650 [Parastagonospora nodorum]|nr:hypothetical protein HBH56_024650 [Parastagonospora nodorum]KAH4096458.1 hypothetical protein HBH46_165300 [Parastagonospora nodorum]KAH4141701.1 hypothetical protein HBH45_059390 [Parastagonospora nodorum]KAH4161502.1 hypothetical protein HBH44_092980 [Parastagonospora nodorum]KAH4363932.1 hypothetical protein HBH97_182880 [Parastagonospora nodorum]
MVLSFIPDELLPSAGLCAASSCLSVMLPCNSGSGVQAPCRSLRDDVRLAIILATTTVNFRIRATYFEDGSTHSRWYAIGTGLYFYESIVSSLVCVSIKNMYSIGLSRRYVSFTSASIICEFENSLFSDGMRASCSLSLSWPLTSEVTNCPKK